jgi:RimJ/RimL family protein N-acetyltransferase
MAGEWRMSTTTDGNGAMADDLSLRAITSADLPELFRHQQDQRALDMAAFPPRVWSSFESHWSRILADPLCLVRGIVRGDQLTGYVASFDQEDERRVGYWVGSEFWGQGIATAALLMYLAVETKRPLHAVVAQHNIGSIRVLEKCGFVRQGPTRTVVDGLPLVLEWRYRLD